MFGRKKAQIQELEAQLQQAAAANEHGQQQYALLYQSYERLRVIVEQAGGNEVLNLQDQISALESQRVAAETAAAARQSEVEQLIAARMAQADGISQEITAKTEQAARLHAELAELQGQVSDAQTLSEYGWNEYTNPAESSIEIGEELAYVRGRIKEMIRAKKAVDADVNFTFNNSKAKGKKFVSDMSKMMLRAYNAEAENCMLTLKAGNGEAARKRLDRAREQVRKLGTLISLDINSEYHMLRHRELTLTLKYRNAQKAEKEAEREERARLREEKKAQQELEAQRKDLEKQRQHYLNVLASLKAQGKDDEIADIESKLADIDHEIEDVDYRAANVRAGYVYVISNIGSFGERMVKIGMTRRLDPMDRVRELSDASVPFNFDVHALFFSEDAVSLETALHHKFADRRVNRINARREFFYVTPLEVRDALKEVGGNLLEFVEEPEAEQYRLSQQIASSEQGATA